jgi:hypothetical protein
MPRDPTIRARFDGYRFKDHEERVADILARGTRVAVATVEPVAAMRSTAREQPGPARRDADTNARLRKGPAP